ncbi:hypothetical protein BGZ73_004168 [Actinomortierella ambigua]|nr:hypothetical protein BGZ73_004168 [Actinomortierella ambigua]
MARPKTLFSAAIMLGCVVALASSIPLEHAQSLPSQQLADARAALSERAWSAQALPVQQRQRRQLQTGHNPLGQGPGDSTQVLPDGPTGDPSPGSTVDTPATTQPPAVTTTNAAVTTTTTTITTTTTTTTTTSSSSSSSSEEETSTSSRRSRTQQTTRPTNPPVHPPGGRTSITTTISPTATPPANDDDNKPPLLPILLGSIIGGVILLSAAAFFIWRWRKSRRFDSKRPLSFVSLPTDMQDVDFDSSAAASHRNSTGRPLTSQPSLRYTPPDSGNTFAALARSIGSVAGGAAAGGAVAGTPMINSAEYRSSFHPSDHSSTVDPYMMDDENTRLVTARDGVHSASPYPTEDAYGMMSMQRGTGAPQGAMAHRQGSGALIGPGMDDDLYLHRPASTQSFVATSMVRPAYDDPIHTRYSRTVNEARSSSPHPSTHESVGAPAAGSPLVQHASASPPGSPHEQPRAPSSLSVRNPTEPSEQLVSDETQYL